jgi:hypothetical protein
MLFYILQFLLIVIWLFVIFAFLNYNTALINLRYIIPLIYLLHILPIHILNYFKNKLRSDSLEESERIEKLIGFYYLKNFFNFSFENPLSAQGLLILGFILSFNKIM